MLNQKVKELQFVSHFPRPGNTINFILKKPQMLVKLLLNT